MEKRIKMNGKRWKYQICVIGRSSHISISFVSLLRILLSSRYWAEAATPVTASSTISYVVEVLVLFSYVSLPQIRIFFSFVILSLSLSFSNFSNLFALVVRLLTFVASEIILFCFCLHFELCYWPFSLCRLIFSFRFHNSIFEQSSCGFALFRLSLSASPPFYPSSFLLPLFVRNENSMTTIFSMPMER